MFTGIVEQTGIVEAKEKKAKQYSFQFRFQKQAKGLAVGQSIAVNGVCLTVTSLKKKSFAADVIPETLAATTLGSLKMGSRVNLERSLKVGDEIGGHFVTGHVDGLGEIAAVTRRNKNYLFRIKAPAAILEFLAVKGSVTVEGVSLTLQSVKKDSFEVGIIPHTAKVTTLGSKKKGDKVNLEIDLTARYLKMFSDFSKKSARSLSVKYLQSRGF